MSEFFERSDVLIEPRGLRGILRLPQQPSGLIIFAHGSGSSRFIRATLLWRAVLNAALRLCCSTS